MRWALSFVLAVALLGWTTRAEAQQFYPKDTETYLINYQTLIKDSTTAYLLSAAPGFGAGHFYAKNYMLGAMMAAGEALGLGLILLGTQVGETGSSARLVLNISGGVFFAGFKAADMFLAPGSVEDYNRVVAEQLRIRPLAVDTGSTNPGGRPHLAWGLTVEGATGFWP
jgi:hypothetical protein